MPPDLVDVTVEKVAIAAVMAGCRPEYLPWVLTVVEAICTDEFNIHGVLATTMPVGPVIVCSGPGTVAIGMNSGVNALGQGNRANSTIGRAVQLVVRNVGGGRPGGVDRATHGNPGQDVVLLRRAARLAVRHAGREPGRDAGGRRRSRCSPAKGRGASSTSSSREPESLARSLAACLRTLHHPKLVLAFDVHPRARAGARQGVRRRRAGIASACSPSSTRCLQLPGAELVRGAGGIDEGLPEHVRRRHAAQVPPGRHAAGVRGWRRPGCSRR